VKPTDQHFDEMCNDHVMWRLTANELLASRDTLVRSRERAEAGWLGVVLNETSDPATFTLWVELMLAGFALENLFKPLWVAKGNKAAGGGRLKFPRGLLVHQLTEIAAGCGFVHTKHGGFILGVLSNVMTGPERYPGGSSSAADLGCWTDKHDEHVIAMLVRVKREIFAAGGE
jgi:hypothetical protein